MFVNDFIEIRYVMVQLGRDHTYQPIVIGAWEFAKEKRRTQPALNLVGVRKRKKHDLSRTSHENRSCKSSSV